MEGCSMEIELTKRVNALVQTCTRLERKIDFLYRHLGVTFVDEAEPPDELEKLCLAGDRIAAVRIYCQHHGVGFVEGKRAVDDICAKLGI
jgi:hypothetical protein